MSGELKPLPCPFCGVTLSKRRGRGVPYWEHDDRDIACIGYTLIVYPDDLAAWNRRAVVEGPKPTAPGTPD